MNAALSSLDLCHAQVALERELREAELLLDTLRASQSYAAIVAEDERIVADKRERVERFRRAHLAACSGEGITLIGGKS